MFSLACSKRSDSGERCGVEKAITFSRSFLLRTAPHYLNAWNRLCFLQTVEHAIKSGFLPKSSVPSLFLSRNL